MYRKVTRVRSHWSHHVSMICKCSTMDLGGFKCAYLSISYPVNKLYQSYLFIYELTYSSVVYREGICEVSGALNVGNVVEISVYAMR